MYKVAVKGKWLKSYSFSQHLFAQSQQQKHLNDLRNMCKVNNKDIILTVFIIGFKQFNKQLTSLAI